MKRTLILCLSLMLPACAESRDGWHPTMEADPPQIGAEAIIYQNRMEQAYVKIDDKLCSATKPGFQQKETYTYQRYHKDHPDKPNDTAKKTFECYAFPDDPSVASVKGFALSGFALSDLYCRTFFRRLALHTNVRKFDHGVVNGVGTLASAILGLASAGSAATGAVGAGFGALDAGFSNYDNTFVVEPDPSLLEGEVLKEQDTVKSDFLESIEKKNSTYYDANQAIERHAYYCTFYGMKAIINSNLQKQAATSPPAKSKADADALGSGLTAYGATLADKDKKQAFNAKFGPLMAKIVSYLSSEKITDAAELQLSDLSSVLNSYLKGPKTDKDQSMVDSQIDATSKALG